MGQKHKDATDKLEAELLDGLIEKQKAIKELEDKL